MFQTEPCNTDELQRGYDNGQLGVRPVRGLDNTTKMNQKMVKPSFSFPIPQCLTMRMIAWGKHRWLNFFLFCGWMLPLGAISNHPSGGTCFYRFHSSPRLMMTASCSRAASGARELRRMKWRGCVEPWMTGLRRIGGQGSDSSSCGEKRWEGCARWSCLVILRG